MSRALLPLLSAIVAASGGEIGPETHRAMAGALHAADDTLAVRELVRTMRRDRSLGAERALRLLIDALG